MMGEYSIAKSFKGILRIAHIIDEVQGDPDKFLNPTYYGTPTYKLDISGTNKYTKQKGTPSAEHSLGNDGLINRYNKPDDELKHCRVPMTDSMGNYLNWNVGVNGVTIGSNQDINGNSLIYDIFYQREENYFGHKSKNIPIYQQKFFPVFETREIIIGKINKEHRIDNKSNINEGSLQIQGNSSNPKLIIENLYDKTQANSTIVPYQGKTLKKYKAIVNEEGTGKFKKLHTVYNNNKQFPQLYDVMMFRQNDWDYSNYAANHVQVLDGDEYAWAESSDFKTTDNRFKLRDYNNFIEDHNDYNKELVKSGYNKGDILDCNVDFVNIVDYVRKVIQKYTKTNIIEVPTGTVIWQYCSLDKWRAYKDAGSSDIQTLSSFPGNRPTLQIRTEISKVSDQENPSTSSETEYFLEQRPYFNSLIQGACKKINKLKRTAFGQDNAFDQHEEDSILLEDSKSGFYEEIIPLYKRDYVLCDGSVYRIPFYPNFLNVRMAQNFIQAKNRFFQLFFNIGYKYTPVEKMRERLRYKKYTFIDKNNKSNSRYYIINDAGKFILQDKMTGTGYPSTSQSIVMNETTFKWATRQFDKYCDNPFTVQNLNDAKPSYHHPQGLKNTNLDIYWGQDWATMIAIDLLYSQFYAYKEKNGFAPSRDYIEQFAKTCPIPEQYIFNSFIGDKTNGISVPYKQKNGRVYSINIGKEINKLGDKISFFDTQKSALTTCEIYKLPMVAFFLDLLVDSNGYHYENQLMKFFYCYYNYDFCVPSLLAEDDSPSFIGSGGYSENDDDMKKLKKVVTWSSRYSHSTAPHRHAVFGGKKVLDNLGNNGAVHSYVSPAITAYDTTKLPAIAGLYSEYSLFDYYGSAKGFGSRYKTQNNTGNYIVNQYVVKTEQIVVDGMNVTILNQTTNTQFEGKSQYGYATGGNRDKTDTRDTTQIFTTKTNNGKISRVQTLTNSQSSIDSYKTHNAKYWYSLSQYEDQRFDTAEPNRGITSQPISSNFQINIDYQKIELNADVYGSTKNEQGQYGWFSPEHITMLPLIKL